MTKPPDNYGIDVAACRGRQRRLLDVMERLRLDLVIVTQNQHVQYLVGPRFEWTFSPAAAIAADGHVTLVAPFEPSEPVAADEVLTYEAKSFSTLRNDQRQKSSQVLLDALGKRSRPKPRSGVEFSSCGPQSGPTLDAELVDVEPEHL